MSSARRLLTVLALAASVVVAGCGDPPDKEMQQAQGAIDAARAAGADRYAQEEFAAAQTALKKAQDAVADRDYRLALNHALDSREQAQNAAKDAADHKATARTDADHAVNQAMAALNDAHTKLKAAETAHVPPRTLAEPRQIITDAEEAVQKARASFAAGDYLGVLDTVGPVTARLHDVAHTLDAIGAPPGRRRR
jgi:flagellar hook-basal body complex protein FliE